MGVGAKDGDGAERNQDEVAAAAEDEDNWDGKEGDHGVEQAGIDDRILRKLAPRKRNESRRGKWRKRKRRPWYDHFDKDNSH